MAIYIGNKKIGNSLLVDLEDDLNKELTEQETLLADLEEDVNALSDKPTDMLQARVDATNSCNNLFYKYEGTTLDISKLDTSNVTSMVSMFQDCTSLTTLDLSNFDTSNVTNMGKMFTSCMALISLDLSGFDTSKVTDMQSMFNHCKVLTNLDLSSFDTSKVKNTSSMFYLCNELLTILGKLNMINVTNTTNMFASCNNLTDVTLLNIKKSLKIGGSTYGTLLSNATLINTIQELWDLTGSTSQTLSLSTTSKENIANIYVKLVDVTDEMLAQDQYAANKKPCVVCESTDVGAMTLTEYATSKNWAIA